MEKKFNRIVLKLSGEALAGGKEFGLDDDTINKISEKIAKISNSGVEVAIVVGGGNFWRGKTSTLMDRATSDNMGMLGTIINALRLQASLEEIGVETRVQTSIEMHEVAETYIRRRAIRHLEKGRVVIFGGGTGLPYFSTDTTAALRAAEIDADIILIGKTGTDGVYDSDPNKNPKAVKFDKISFKEVLNLGLEVMDSTATSMCMENNMPVVIFGIDDSDNLLRVINNEEIGTIIS